MAEQQTLYCISCGNVSDIEPVDFSELAPTDFEVVCPSCGTKWRVSIEFHEIEAND